MQQQLIVSEGRKGGYDGMMQWTHLAMRTAPSTTARNSSIGTVTLSEDPRQVSLLEERSGM